MLHKLHNSFLLKKKITIINFLSYYTFMYILSFIRMPFLFADQFRYVIKQNMFLFLLKMSQQTGVPGFVQNLLV